MAMALTAWDEDFVAVVARLGPRFARAEARRHAADYLRGHCQLEDAPGGQPGTKAGPGQEGCAAQAKAGTPVMDLCRLPRLSAPFTASVMSDQPALRYAWWRPPRTGNAVTAAAMPTASFPFTPGSGTC